MRILIITDSYFPETRSSSYLMKELAEGLAKRGHTVFVVTSLPPKDNFPKNARITAGVSNENNVTVIRVRVLPHHNVNFILKGISQLTLPFIFLWRVKKHIKEKLDFAWVHSPPLPLTLTAQAVKKNYGAKFILNLHDFFPQNAIDLGVLKNRVLIKFFSWLEKYSYRRADFIVVPSESHKKFLEQNYKFFLPKIYVIYHWINLELFQQAKNTGSFRKSYNLENKFIFIFGGVLGPSQGLKVFIEIAKKLKNKDIVFLFVGEGSEKNKLIQFAGQYRLKNVIFKPFVLQEYYPNLLKEADVGILSLTDDNTTPAVPAKLMGYMAAGLPVLALLHKKSDGIKIIKEAKCGWTFPYSEDREKLAKLVDRIYLEKDKLKIYGRNGLEYAKNHFSKEVILNKIEKLLIGKI